jgi:curved DNA-binding protein
MEYKDYYKILGLERSATQDEIKTAFRKLARKFHPDVSKESGAEARFKEISEAYEVLGDAEKRAAYDQLGKDWKAGQEFRPPPGWDEGFEFAGPSFERGGFSDFFESLFGGMRRGREAPFRGEATFRARGEDHHARILIDLRDAFTGATRPVSLHAPAVDEAGHVVRRDRVLNVQIPKGVTEGQHIRLKGQGAPGIGGAPAGDLYLEVGFKPDPLYRVAGRDLYLGLPVAPWEAALGASVRTPTPAGPIMLDPLGPRRGGSCASGAAASLPPSPAISTPSDCPAAGRYR